MTQRVPRGIRNKNPGNIRVSPHFDWQGEVKFKEKHPRYDADFCTFSEVQMGLRAMMKLLINYQQKHGLDTIKKAIGRYAPNNENDTKAYVRDVADWADLDPNKSYDFTDIMLLVPLCKAMVRKENGTPSTTEIEQGVVPYQWYSNKTYQEAYELAKRGRIVSHSPNNLVDKPAVFGEPRRPTIWERFLKWLEKSGD